MHRHHLIGCGAGIALALLVVVLTGGSAGSVGVLAAALLCPLIMIGALVLLTRPERTARGPHDPTTPAEGSHLHPPEVSSR